MLRQGFSRHGFSIDSTTSSEEALSRVETGHYDAAVVDLVMTLLAQGGWRVDVASTGKSGLGLLRGRPYDLVVSDIRMPNGSGQHLYENAIAHDPSLRDRFIFITGDTANPEVAAFLQDSGVPIVEKPFQPVVFLEAVHRVASVLPRPRRG